MDSLRYCQLEKLESGKLMSLPQAEKPQKPGNKSITQHSQTVLRSSPFAPREITLVRKKSLVVNFLCQFRAGGMRKQLSGISLISSEFLLLMVSLWP